jgi:transcriptional regulator with XRE-family HTH domain
VPDTPPPTPLGRALGVAIRERRSTAGLTIEALADAAKMNTTYVSDIERGRQNPSLRKIEDLAGALDVAVSDLLREAEQLVEQ